MCRGSWNEVMCFRAKQENLLVGGEKQQPGCSALSGSLDEQTLRLLSVDALRIVRRDEA